jgi:hypothetical protein
MRWLQRSPKGARERDRARERECVCVRERARAREREREREREVCPHPNSPPRTHLLLLLLQGPCARGRNAHVYTHEILLFLCLPLSGFVLAALGCNDAFLTTNTRPEKLTPSHPPHTESCPVPFPAREGVASAGADAGLYCLRWSRVRM